jgi:hypothetical protein
LQRRDALAACPEAGHSHLRDEADAWARDQMERSGKRRKTFAECLVEVSDDNEASNAQRHIERLRHPRCIVRVDLASGQRSLVRTIRPLDTAGIVAVAPVLMTRDGKAYTYGYNRQLSDLFVAEGPR